MKYTKTIILFIIFFFLSCDNEIVPDLRKIFNTANDSYLYGVEMGIKQQKIRRDDEQNLILVLAKERLPLYREVLPSFSIASSAQIWPMDVAYFASFQAANPKLNIESESFLFPEIAGKKLIKTLAYAINTGEVVSFPPLTKTVISSNAEHYVPGGAYNYIVMAESGKISNWRIKVVDPDKERAYLVEASLLESQNPQLAQDFYGTIDHTQAIVAWVVPYGTSLSSLVPYFVAGSDRPIHLNGKIYSKGSAVDFTGVNSLEVTSPSGLVTKDYLINIVQAPSENALFSFVIPKIDNPGLGQRITLVFTGPDKLEAKVPFGTQLSWLKGWASLSAGATASTAGKAFIGGETMLDFSGGKVTLTIGNSDGSRSQDYTLSISEDRSQADLLRLSMGKNPDLKKNEGSIYLSKNQVDIFIYQDWDFVTQGSLEFEYAISPGARAELDGTVVNSTLLQLENQTAELKVISNDGKNTNIYQISLSSITDNISAELLSFGLDKNENPELIRSFYTKPQVDKTISGLLLSPKLDSLITEIRITPGATARWEDGKPYDEAQAVDFRKPRILTLISPDGSTEYPYTINLASAQPPKPLYVQVQPAKTDGNGSSWDEAILLHEALNWINVYSDISTQIYEIWLEQGTYIPEDKASVRPYTYIDLDGKTHGTNTFTNYYTVPPQVAIYGGFTGSEMQRSARDIAAHPTIISADVLGDDDYSSRSSSENNRSDNLGVLFASGKAENITIDGLIFRGISHVNPADNPKLGISFYGSKSSTLLLMNNRIEHSYALPLATTSGAENRYFSTANIKTSTIKNNKFIENRGDWSSPTVADGTIFVEDNLYQGNTALLSISSEDSTVTAKGNTFQDNQSSWTMWARGEKITLTDNKFKDNQGTVKIETKTATLTLNTFEKTASWTALYLKTDNGTLKKNIFRNNEGTGTGALYMVRLNVSLGTKATLINNDFIGNSASHYNGIGAVRIQMVQGVAILTKNTFDGNTGGSAGALGLSNIQKITLTGNTFKNNLAEIRPYSAGSTGATLLGGYAGAIYTLAPYDHNTDSVDWPVWDSSKNEFEKNIAEDGGGVSYTGIWYSLGSPRDNNLILSGLKVKALIDSAPATAFYSQGGDTFTNNSSPALAWGDRSGD